MLPEYKEIWQETLGWCPSSEQQQQFEQLYQGILAGNRQLNLTRITDPEAFWEKHLWDSLRGVSPLGWETLANASIALDAANDRVEFDADNPSYTALDAGTIAAAIIFKQVNDDTDSPLIAQIDFADLVTNGSDVELQINTEGLFYVTNNIT